MKRLILVLAFMGGAVAVAKNRPSDCAASCDVVVKQMTEACKKVKDASKSRFCSSKMGEMSKRCLSECQKPQK